MSPNPSLPLRYPKRPLIYKDTQAAKNAAAMLDKLSDKRCIVILTGASGTGKTSALYKISRYQDRSDFKSIYHDYSFEYEYSNPRSNEFYGWYRNFIGDQIDPQRYIPHLQAITQKMPYFHHIFLSNWYTWGGNSPFRNTIESYAKSIILANLVKARYEGGHHNPYDVDLLNSEINTFAAKDPAYTHTDISTVTVDDAHRLTDARISDLETAWQSGTLSIILIAPPREMKRLKKKIRNRLPIHDVHVFGEPKSDEFQHIAAQYADYYEISLRSQQAEKLYDELNGNLRHLIMTLAGAKALMKLDLAHEYEALTRAIAMVSSMHHEPLEA